MSDDKKPSRPSAPPRQITVNPVLDEEHTSVPVTPVLESASDDQFGGRPPSFERLAEINASQNDGNGGAQTEPTHAGSDVKSSEELLRRFSLSSERSKKNDLADVDPRAAHPNLPRMLSSSMELAV